MWPTIIFSALLAALLVTPASEGQAQTRVGDAPPPASADGRAGADAGPRSAGETEEAARTRIEGAGYSDVSGLQRDSEGVWRGRAKRGSNPVEVSVDRLGNVTAAPTGR